MVMFTGNRGLALNFLRSAASKGISFADTFRQLKAAGMATYRRNDMLSDYRQFLGIDKRANTLKYMRLDYYPSVSSYTQTTGFQRTTYRYEIKVNGYNRTTGKAVELSTNVSSDIALTRRQSETAGIDSLYPSLDQSQIEVTGLVLNAAYHIEGAEY